MTGADDPGSDTEVPICVRLEVVALACSRVRSMGEEFPHSTDSSERLSDNPGTGWISGAGYNIGETCAPDWKNSSVGLAKWYLPAFIYL
jgi:hypothetical protein